MPGRRAPSRRGQAIPGGVRSLHRVAVGWGRVPAVEWPLDAGERARGVYRACALAPAVGPRLRRLGPGGLQPQRLLPVQRVRGGVLPNVGPRVRGGGAAARVARPAVLQLGGQDHHRRGQVRRQRLRRAGRGVGRRVLLAGGVVQGHLPAHLAVRRAPRPRHVPRAGAERQSAEG